VIFDWDGVLLDSLGSSFNVYNRIFEELGTKQLTRDEFLGLQSPNWYEFYTKVGLPASRWEYVDREWLLQYEQEKPALYLDTRKCLADLSAAGLRLALVSNGSEVRVRKELVAFGLAPAFESVLCGRTREELKPSPVMLQRTLSTLELAPTDVVYVGDSPADIQASRNAGIVSVAIWREPVLKGRLRAERPDHLFGGLGALASFLSIPGVAPPS
jgi:HAD superfamily hydrolase (TIGR01509 family)